MNATSASHRPLLALAAGLVTAFGVTQAQGTLLYYEGFDYAPLDPVTTNSINNQRGPIFQGFSAPNGGTGFSGAWSGSTLFETQHGPSAGLTFGSLVVSGGSAISTPFPSTGGSFSFPTRNLSSTINLKSGDAYYFSGLIRFEATTTGNTFASQQIRQQGSGDRVDNGLGFNRVNWSHFTESLSSNVFIDNGASVLEEPLLFYVQKIVWDGSEYDVQVWQYNDPAALDASEPMGAALDDRKGGATNYIEYSKTSLDDLDNGINQIGLGNFGLQMTHDELRGATTWAEAAPIPEPASLSVLALGALLAGVRRRSA